MVVIDSSGSPSRRVVSNALLLDGLPRPSDTSRPTRFDLGEDLGNDALAHVAHSLKDAKEGIESFTISTATERKPRRLVDV